MTDLFKTDLDKQREADEIRVNFKHAWTVAAEEGEILRQEGLKHQEKMAEIYKPSLLENKELQR